MTKTYTVTNARTNQEVLVGTLAEWDHWYGLNCDRWDRPAGLTVDSDTRTEKRITVRPRSSAPLLAALLYAYAPIPALAGVLKCQGIFDDNMSAIVYRKDFTADQVVVLSGYRGDRIYSVDHTPFGEKQ